jgi:hypothetical protein
MLCGHRATMTQKRVPKIHKQAIDELTDLLQRWKQKYKISKNEPD